MRSITTSGGSSGLRMPGAFFFPWHEHVVLSKLKPVFFVGTDSMFVLSVLHTRHLLATAWVLGQREEDPENHFLKFIIYIRHHDL